MSIQYFHTTVPHSGTRYINCAVEEATGLRVVQTPTFKQYKNAGEPAFVFAHVGARWIDFVKYGIENSEKPWMTVRSPIHTWGTQWKNMESPIASGNQYAWKEKLGQMRQQYMTQRELLEEYPDLYIHKVEDGLDGLSEYLGLDLKEHERTFTRESPMKQALKHKDLSRMELLCQQTDFFKGFQQGITPELREFYENLGYEIWWA